MPYKSFWIPPNIFESYREIKNPLVEGHWATELAQCMGLVDVNFASTGDAEQLVVVDEDKLKALRHRLVTSPDEFTAVFRRYDTKLKNSYFDHHLEKLIHYRG